VSATATVMPAPVIAPGAVLELSGIEWTAREIMVAVAGPISEKIGPRCTIDEIVALHEAAHVVLEFLLGRRLHGASIVPWEGHSLGRASSRKPTLGDLKTPWPSDDQTARDYSMLAGLDRAELEAATEKLLCDYWPLVRRLARALVERKEISARSCRRILLAAMRKDLRRSRAATEKDLRNQAAWGAELRRELGWVA
jgi:hypothetical protein